VKPASTLTSTDAFSEPATQPSPAPTPAAAGAALRSAAAVRPPSHTPSQREPHAMRRAPRGCGALEERAPRLHATSCRNVLSALRRRWCGHSSVARRWEAVGVGFVLWSGRPTTRRAVKSRAPRGQSLRRLPTRGCSTRACGAPHTALARVCRLAPLTPSRLLPSESEGWRPPRSRLATAWRHATRRAGDSPSPVRRPRSPSRRTCACGLDATPRRLSGGDPNRMGAPNCSRALQGPHLEGAAHPRRF
jgi:hypothetical protein